MKLFNTNNIDTVKACQEFFSFELLIVLAKRVVKFESKVSTFNSVLLYILSGIMCNCVDIIM